jgi:hypothetical protein
MADEVSHAAKQLSKWRNVVGHRARPLGHGMAGTGSSRRATRVLSKLSEMACRWTAMGARPRPTVHPMARVGIPDNAMAAGLQRLLWPGRPRMGAFGRP